MYRLLIFVIQLILLLTILTFIFSNPFIISLDIGNYKYSFVSNIFAGVFLVFLFLFYLLIYVFFRSRFSVKCPIRVDKIKPYLIRTKGRIILIKNTMIGETITPNKFGIKNKSFFKILLTVIDLSLGVIFLFKVNEFIVTSIPRMFIQPYPLIN